MASTSIEGDIIDPAAKRIKTEEGDDETIVDLNAFSREYVCEEECGIKYFIKKEEPIQGIFKHRYTDFLVNEIDPNGNVVHLTTLHSSALDESSGNSFTVDFENAEKDLVALMEGQDSSYIPKVIEMAKNGKKDEEALFIPLKDTTKEWRTSFHQYIRENLPTLRSETKTKEGGNSDMKVWFGGKDSDNKRRGWPSDRPKHLKFVLYKENKDTTDAIQILSKLLKVKPNLFTFAGTKDKRGVTCQYVTVPKIEASRMAALNKRLLGLKVGNFEYVPQELRLGDHKGNEFTIIIRDIDDPEAVKRSCDIISENGFINYFGMQRFGTGSIPTHHIGKLCMQENWKQVVEDILRPRKGEPTVARNARSYYNKTQDIRGTLKKLPKFLHVERYVLEGLEKHGKTNYLSAFQSIPKQMRLMYIHAYQSYVWNEVVSKRIELFGYQKLVKGDLVAIGELREGDPESNIKVIKSDEEGSNFSIEDLVLPLPGTKIMYPENAMRDHYIEVMARDNLCPTELDKHKEFCLPGSYRRVFNRPSGFFYEFIEYLNENADLLTTDLDILNSKSISLEESELQTKKVALKARFSLPSSSYATVLLREVFKRPFDMSTIRN